MDFGFSDEQELLRAQAARFMEALAGEGPLRERASAVPGPASPLWGRIAELGWCGLLVPAERGGAGLEWVDAALLLETTGRGLLPAPLLSTLLSSWAIAAFASPAQCERWLPALVRGERIATPALLDRSQTLDPRRLAREDPASNGLVHAERCFVHDADSADLFLVALRIQGELALAVVERDAPGVVVTAQPSIDPTKRLGQVQLQGSPIDPDAVLLRGESAERATGQLLDAGAVACAAEMLGAAEGAHALTVQYARERRQFGHPIGRFQGVKHPLAEHYVQIETTRSLVYFAAWALDAEPESVPRAASMAKASATESLGRMGVDAVQLHGAIGYTAECDAQLYLKRSKWARPAFGDAAYHYDRIAGLRGATWTSA